MSSTCQLTCVDLRLTVLLDCKCRRACQMLTIDFDVGITKYRKFGMRLCSVLTRTTHRKASLEPLPRTSHVAGGPEAYLSPRMQYQLDTYRPVVSWRTTLLMSNVIALEACGWQFLSLENAALAHPALALDMQLRVKVGGGHDLSRIVGESVKHVPSGIGSLRNRSIVATRPWQLIGSR
jgi:hypothetical protein